MGGIASIQPATKPLPLFLPFFTNPMNRHFDRSRSRFCERRSGEIRFSTSTLDQPLCLCRYLLSPLPLSLGIKRRALAFWD
jgi:hypothetical protein